MQHHHFTTSTCWCHFTHKPKGNRTSVCSSFPPSHKVWFLPPHTASLNLSLLQIRPSWKKKKKFVWQQKCKQFSSFYIKSLKYITGPGKMLIWKTYTLKYFQLKITNNYHVHFAIFNNLFFTKLFLWRSLLNRNSWLKLSERIYGSCKQSTMLLAQCKANKKSLLSFTQGQMEHMQIQQWYANYYFQQDQFDQKIPSTLYWQNVLALIGQRLMSKRNHLFTFIHPFSVKCVFLISVMRAAMGWEAETKPGLASSHLEAT